MVIYKVTYMEQLHIKEEFYYNEGAANKVALSYIRDESKRDVRLDEVEVIGSPTNASDAAYTRGFCEGYDRALADERSVREVSMQNKLNTDEIPTHPQDLWKEIKHD